ncbi:hypothetical protein ACLOJK_020189 [Asimina triloba]
MSRGAIIINHDFTVKLTNYTVQVVQVSSFKQPTNVESEAEPVHSSVIEPIVIQSEVELVVEKLEESLHLEVEAHCDAEELSCYQLFALNTEGEGRPLREGSMVSRAPSKPSACSVTVKGAKQELKGSLQVCPQTSTMEHIDLLEREAWHQKEIQKCKVLIAQLTKELSESRHALTKESLHLEVEAYRDAEELGCCLPLTLPVACS